MGYSVYKHTSPSNKVYIGITSCVPKDRWHGGSGYRHNEYFYRAIKKYGWNNFKHEILFSNLSKEDAEEKEIELINFYKSNYRDYGYNIHSGGGSRIGNKMPKGYDNAKHKVIYQYDLNGNFIREYGGLREAARILGKNSNTIQSCCKGHSNTAYGYQWKYKDDDRVIGEIVRNKKLEENKALFRKVKCVETGEIFDSIKYANQHYNTQNVSRACRYHLTSGGYHWEYVDEMA